METKRAARFESAALFLFLVGTVVIRGFTMFATKGWVRIRWATVCLGLVGTLTLTLMVFAGSDTSEHGASEHYHTTSASARNTPEKVEWRVSIGDLD